MRTNKIYTYALLLAGLFLALSCAREEDRPGIGDGALTAHIVQEGTRTAYDNETGDFSWAGGDRIALHLSDGSFHEANVQPATGVFSYTRVAGVTRDFYAVYPADWWERTDYGNPTLSINYPSVYDIREDLTSNRAPLPMVAVNRDSEDDLYFRQVGGLLRLYCHSVPSETVALEVTMDKAITGLFSVTDPASAHPSTNAVAATGDRETVTFSISDNGLTAPADIILNLPLPCGEYDRVTVVAKDWNNEIIGDDYRESISIRQGHGVKVTLQVVPSEIVPVQEEEIRLSLSDPRKVTYVFALEFKAGVNRSTLPWVARFSSTEPVGTEKLADMTEDFPDWFTMTPTSGDGFYNKVVFQKTDLPFDAAGVDPNNTAEASADITALKANKVEDRDLSTWDFISGADGGAETANCYVIDGWGTYLLPLVYGNAITGGTDNPSAYTPATGGTLQLPGFVNADTGMIENPYILADANLTCSDDLSARVVWQDTYPGAETLTDDDLTLVMTPGTAVNAPYIRLSFRKEAIKPCNIVVALYDNGNDKILWSWHLWVTNDTLNKIPVLQEDDATYSYVLNENLGWTPPVHYADVVSEKRGFIVFFAQDTGDYLGVYPISRATESQRAYTGIAYSNTFYNWGRKDPILPDAGDGTRNKCVSSSPLFPVTTSNGNRVVGGNNNSPASLTAYGYMVTHPNQPWNGDAHPDYINIWNPALTSGMGDDPMTKTVYDPCPRGFHVPHKLSFSGFRAGSKWVSASGVIPCGIKVTRTHSESDIDLFFPCGMRDFWTVYGLIDHSLFQSGEKHTYYWTSGALASSGTWTAGNVVSFAPSIEGHPNGYFYAPTAGSSNASGEFLATGLSIRPVSDQP